MTTIIQPMWEIRRIASPRDTGRRSVSRTRTFQTSGAILFGIKKSKVKKNEAKQNRTKQKKKKNNQHGPYKVEQRSFSFWNKRRKIRKQASNPSRNWYRCWALCLLLSFVSHFRPSFAITERFCFSTVVIIMIMIIFCLLGFLSLSLSSSFLPRVNFLCRWWTLNKIP